MDASQVDFGVLNGVGTLSLRREAALNALTLDMVRDCRRVVRGCGEDEQVKAVVVRGEGDKAFCAGGDVRRLAGRPEEALRFFKEEYGLDWQIRELRKPVVALMDGIVMGGGAGIATNCTYRIVSDKTVFAMPEVSLIT